MNGYEKLSRLLCKQVENQNKLLELENRKTKVLVNQDIQQLDEILKTEQSLIMNNENIENHYQDLQQEIAFSGLTLKEIIEKCDLENKYFLESRLNELSVLVKKLKKVNRINIEILNLRLSMINQFNSFLGLKEEINVYKKNGQYESI